jgi:hypothetical protein
MNSVPGLDIVRAEVLPVLQNAASIDQPLPLFRNLGAILSEKDKVYVNGHEL